LVLKKISKTVATICHILTLKCTKFDFGRGSAPDPVGGAYSAAPGPQLVLRGPTSNGRQGRKDGRKKQGWRGGDLVLRRGERRGKLLLAHRRRDGWP